MPQLNHQDLIIHLHGLHLMMGIGHSQRECSPLYHGEVHTHTQGICISSFILPSQSWKIGSPPLCGARKMKLYCDWHIHLNNSFILRKDHPLQHEHCQCVLTVCHSFVEYNHLIQQGNIYLVTEKWWKHFDLTLIFHSNF